MTVDIYEDILRLEVAIEHVLVVDVLQTEQNLRKIELSLRLSEQSLVLKQVKKLTT